MTPDKLSTNLTETERYIDFSELDSRPRICGGMIHHFSRLPDDRWICNLCCRTPGSSYEEAVRAKINFDFEKFAARTHNFLKQFHVSL